MLRPSFKKHRAWRVTWAQTWLLTIYSGKLEQILCLQLQSYLWRAAFSVCQNL